MPLGGTDTRYDLPWQEQDKIRRRLELKQRLKEEGVRRRYSPFLAMKNEIFQDPAVDRYMDLRKRGRLPNTPVKPAMFYTAIALFAIPITIFSYAMEWERQPYLDGCEKGDIPYEDRKSKSVG